MPRKKEKPYNNGTMTEAGFWGMIRSALRQKSRWWKPLTEAKNRVRRKYKGSNKRQKWEYQCNHCKNWFKGTDVQVDHIEEVGSLKSGDDLKGFVERLFCEVGGFQVLCKECHKIKTKNYMKNRKV